MRNVKEFCVYKFYNEKDNLLYVGKTTNLKNRINSHSLDKYWWKEVKYILYAHCNSATDMDIYEIYYINKLHPKYNKQSVNNDNFSFNLNELQFKRIENTYTKHNNKDKYIKYKPNKNIEKLKDIVFPKKVIYINENIFELDNEELLLLSILNDNLSKNGVTIDVIMPYLYYDKNYFLDEWAVSYYLQSLIFKGYINCIEVDGEHIYFCNELKEGKYISHSIINWLVRGDIDFLELRIFYRMKYIIKKFNKEINLKNVCDILNLPECIFYSTLKKFEDLFIIYYDSVKGKYRFTL